MQNANKLKQIFVVISTINCLLFSQTNVSEPAPQISTFSTDPNIVGALTNSVNLFSGDVNLPITLVSIPGKNGLNVNVSMTYSSNVQNNVGIINLESPTGILGLGWSIDYPKIIVNHKNTGTYYDDDYYLIYGGTNNLLVRTGGSETVRKYCTKNYLYWDITYYSDSLKWIIIDENGIKYEYGNKNNERNTIQWGIKWGSNWIGESVQSSGQKRFPIAWNLSKVYDVWGNKILYSYFLQDTTVGNNGTLEHTEASYLSNIIDTYGNNIEFVYDKKNSYEYQDPQTGTNEPDAYQEHYEKYYLDSIYVNNPSDNNLLSIYFNYSFIDGNTDSTKRILKSVTQYNANRDSIPNIYFEYFTNGIEKGKLKKVISPMGGSVEYNYSAQSINKSVRNFTVVSPETGYGKPRIWTQEDYVIVTWYNATDDSVKIYAYYWDGRWIDCGCLITIPDVDIEDNKQDFEISIEKDFFAIIDHFYDDTNVRLPPIFGQELSEVKV